jgi:RNA polymerase sigma-70 factor, ECF subfamily
MDPLQSEPDDAARSFQPLRGYLIGLAYRMLGSRAEAEDMVQEAYLRWHDTDRAAVREPRAFLSKTVTRLCLDHLKSARSRREEYVGQWLPEPILDDAALSPQSASEYANDLSVALLLTLERLSPLERAAFLLHDVFDMDFNAVGEALGRDAAACRQLASRARSHVREERPRFRPSPEEEARVFSAFTDALGKGDMDGLVRVLASDAVFYSDGGGKATALSRPLDGAERIAKFLHGVVTRLWNEDIKVRPARVNGMPGLVLSKADGPMQTFAFEIGGGLITRIYTVRNPDKLQYLN